MRTHSTQLMPGRLLYLKATSGFNLGLSSRAYYALECWLTQRKPGELLISFISEERTPGSSSTMETAMIMRWGSDLVEQVSWWQSSLLLCFRQSPVLVMRRFSRARSWTRAFPVLDHFARCNRHRWRRAVFSDSPCQNRRRAGRRFAHPSSP